MVGAALGILTETKAKHGGRGLTKWGKALLCVTLTSGIVGLVADGIKNRNEARDAAAQEKKTTQLLDETKRSVDAETTIANKQTTIANEQRAIALRASQELGIVREDLDRERTPVFRARIAWIIWVQSNNQCLSEFVKRSSPVSDEEGAGDEPEAAKFGQYREPPLLSSLSEGCQRQLGDFFEEFHLAGFLLPAGEDVFAYGIGLIAKTAKISAGWSFEAIVPGNDVILHQFLWQEKSRRLLFFSEKMLEGNDLKREDGGQLSLLDLSQASMGLSVMLGKGPLFESGLFGMQCVTFDLNGQRPFTFGLDDCPFASTTIIPYSHRRKPRTSEAPNTIRTKSSYAIHFPQITRSTSRR